MFMNNNKVVVFFFFFFAYVDVDGSKGKSKRVFAVSKTPSWLHVLHRAGGTRDRVLSVNMIYFVS